MADEDQLPVPPEPEEEAAPVDCPPCKAGSPAWMATFADMATLLMAFFVLLLSFAHVNVPKYKEVSGSMTTKFGVQKDIPVIEPPKANNIVVEQYRSAMTEPTAMPTIEEQRTDEPQPEEEELRTDIGDGESPTQATQDALEQVLAQQIAEGKVRVTSDDQKVQVEVLPQATQGTQSASSTGTPVGQVPQDSLEIYAAVAAAQTSSSAQIELIDSNLVNSLSANSDGADPSGTARESLADSQYELIRANLSNEIAAGLAQVEREGDKVIIRVAEQGSFASGQAELQGGFASLLDRVGASLTGASGLVTIEGHTDDVPLGFGSRYRSNWDLSAARSAAVADYLLEREFLQPGNVNVLGLADTRPVADNASITGRAANRRIEIIVDN